MGEPWLLEETMKEDSRKGQRSASGPSANKPPALLVRLTSPAQVHIIATDWHEEQRARPFAELVEHVLRTALKRPTGTA